MISVWSESVCDTIIWLRSKSYSRETNLDMVSWCFMLHLLISFFVDSVSILGRRVILPVFGKVSKWFEVFGMTWYGHMPLYSQKTDGVFVPKPLFFPYHGWSKWIDPNLLHHFCLGEYVSLPGLSKITSSHEPRQALYGAMSKHVDLGASAEDDCCFPGFRCRLVVGKELVQNYVVLKLIPSWCSKNI